MYISVGFTHPCLLQILSLNRQDHSYLQLILYDGKAYAGALYRIP